MPSFPRRPVIPAQAGIQRLDPRFRGGDVRRRHSRPVIPAPSRHSRASGNPARSTPVNRKQPAVYILASRRNGTLYIGVTSDLARRVWEHKNDVRPGFTARYGVHRLVYYELHEDMTTAITREKQLKKWNRAWKLQLIEKENPEWRDLWEQIS